MIIINDNVNEEVNQKISLNKDNINEELHSRSLEEIIKEERKLEKFNYEIVAMQIQLLKAMMKPLENLNKLLN